MYKDSHFFCLTPELQFQFAEDVGGELIQNKIIKIPSDIGEGEVLFIQAIPGLAILLWKCHLKKALKIKAYKDNIERYIFHYDISVKSNFLTICEKKIEIGNVINTGLVIFTNQQDSFFEPSVNDKTFAIRLYIDKKLLQTFVSQNKNVKKKLKLARKVFFYDDIDANSLLRILSANEKSLYEESFDAYLKGIGLQLLANFIKKNSDTEAQSANYISKSEEERLDMSKNYLTKNLRNHFPSITFLSELTGMSSTKFKILFKKKFNTTPKNLFIHEKMNLAQKMLQSGDFNTLTEIVHELNYNKLHTFSSRYFQIFNKIPAKDFIKKKN